MRSPARKITSTWQYYDTQDLQQQNAGYFLPFMFSILQQHSTDVEGREIFFITNSSIEESNICYRNFTSDLLRVVLPELNYHQLRGKMQI